MKKNHRLWLIALPALVVLSYGMYLYQGSRTTQAINSRLNSPELVIEAAGVRLSQPELVRATYQSTGYRPIWTKGSYLPARSKAFVEFLRSSTIPIKGHAGYHIERIQSLLDNSRPGVFALFQSNVDLELLLTDAFLELGSHLQNGAVDPHATHPEWFCHPPNQRNNADIIAASKASNVVQALHRLEPSDSRSIGLRKALEDYCRIKKCGGWPRVPDGPMLQTGDHDERVTLLRKRLQISGDLAAGAPIQSATFDADLAQALSGFQARHTLRESGMLDAATLKELNTSVEKRVLQIELNLERLRWLPRKMADRHIFVNVAACTLELIDNDAPVLTKKAIVGGTAHKTVLLTDAVFSLEINPIWDVPYSIIYNEMLSDIKNDPNWLDTEGFRLMQGLTNPTDVNPNAIDWNTVDLKKMNYRIFQNPGPKNPMGYVKFLMPNKYDILVHDTSRRELFQNDRRTLSHGCIRLEKPLELASHLLGSDPKENDRVLHEAVESGTTQLFQLPHAVPIYIHYLTAWPDHQGKPHFCRDVYKVDKAIAGVLKPSKVSKN